ncbi:penicillin-binding protein activator LpoB [Vibrio vulnificus]|nr:penicillin-binding protein activator LpoB [Vibrio vulnificus]
MKKNTIAAVMSCALLSGCQTPTAYIDASDTQNHVAAALTYADFNKAASELAEEVIAAPGIGQKDGSRTIVYVAEITNDTMQRIDTEQLTKGIRVKMLQSGKFAMTTAMGEDNTIHKMSELKKSKTFNEATVKTGGKALAPDFSLTGKIMQRDLTLDNGDTRIEYYFQMSLTHLEYGIAYWEGERVIGKVADGDTVSW